MNTSFATIAFKLHYKNNSEYSSTTRTATFAIFEYATKCQKIDLQNNTDLSQLGWVMRGVCLANRSIWTRVLDFFSFLGYESSIQKADRLYYALLNVPVNKMSVESEIEIKLKFRNSFKDALPLILKLKNEELETHPGKMKLLEQLDWESKVTKDPYIKYIKRYFDTSLFFNDWREAEKVIKIAPKWLLLDKEYQQWGVEK